MSRASDSAAWALACVWSVLAAACGAEPGPRNVLLVSIDTCRADHLSAYGYARPTSPFLEELAARGVLFERAFCQVPDTTPSHASLLTSTYPDEHGSANGVPLADGLETLAEVLVGRGYRTGAFVSGLTMTARRSGLARGFQVYDDELDRIGSHDARRPNERRAEDTTYRAIRWLAEDQARPFFLFVHYFDPHGVYAPPPPYDALFEPARPAGAVPRRLASADIPAYARIEGEDDLDVYLARYDGEIRYVDDQLRRLVAALRARGLEDETLVVVTADHGEDLGEHGLYFSHGLRLYDPALHIPLIVSAPGGPRGRRVPELVETIDVAPTVLALLGLEAPAGMRGESLVDLMRGERDPTSRFVLARTTKTLTYLRIRSQHDVRDWRALRGERWKLVVSEDGAELGLFDLERDPGERRDVASQEPEVRAALRGVLDGILRPLQQAGPGRSEPAMTAEEREQLLEELRALGYVR